MIEQKIASHFTINCVKKKKRSHNNSPPDASRHPIPASVLLFLSLFSFFFKIFVFPLFHALIESIDTDTERWERHKDHINHESIIFCIPTRWCIRLPISDLCLWIIAFVATCVLCALSKLIQVLTTQKKTKTEEKKHTKRWFWEKFM